MHRRSLSASAGSRKNCWLVRVCIGVRKSKIRVAKQLDSPKGVRLQGMYGTSLGTPVSFRGKK